MLIVLYKGCEYGTHPLQILGVNTTPVEWQSRFRKQEIIFAYVIFYIYLGHFSWPHERFRICWFSFCFASLLQCMVFSQLLMKLCRTVDIILPKGTGGTLKIMKSKVSRVPRPSQNGLILWSCSSKACYVTEIGFNFSDDGITAPVFMS